MIIYSIFQKYEKQFKDAYVKVGQTIRLYLSYELNLNKEITNEELLPYLGNR